jgi:hypothetical protein
MTLPARRSFGSALLGLHLAAAFLLMAVLCAAAIPVRAQQPNVPIAPAEAGEKKAPGNTTVIRRTPGKSAPGKSTTAVTLAAYLIDNGARIDRGVVWRVYDAVPTKGRNTLVATLKESIATVRLPPGDYLVNAAFGRAHLTKLVSVTGDAAQEESFVLNAGGLRVTAVLANGEPAPESSTTYDIFTDERDQFGERTKLMSSVKLGLIVRLNAGIYHVVSTYGDANAVERSDVTVEAGKLTQVVVKHSAARVTLKLVARAGGEALADTKWSLLTPDGQVVKESLGALPTHILKAGAYTAVAVQGGQSFKTDFTVAAGERKQVEVVMR